MRGKKRFMKNSMRRGCSRILAGLMCLCMVLSVFSRSGPVQAQESPKMTVYVYLWHTDDATGKLLGDHPYTLDATENPSRSIQVPATYNGEKFTAFSVSTGQSAIEKLGNDEVPPTAYVKYSPLIQTVKINAFYSINQDNAGIEFGGTEAFINVDDPEIDTVENINKKSIMRALRKTQLG